MTTVVTGNCGFTPAPCRPEDCLTLMKMLEYVEGMSLEAMQKGIQWEFETFREYLDALDRLPLWGNVAPACAHGRHKMALSELVALLPASGRSCDRAGRG